MESREKGEATGYKGRGRRLFVAGEVSGFALTAMQTHGRKMAAADT